jgi:hypothetical protein
MRGALVWGLAIASVLAGCGGGSEHHAATTPPSSSFDAIPRISPIPIPVPPGATLAPTSGCDLAPGRVVDIINASFTNGEHLEHAQSVDGPKAVVFVGGNIFDATGTKVSSQDTWALSDGQVYALTSDARRHTLLPDGRDLPTMDWDWADYNDTVSKCVGDVERAENQGR